MMQSMKSMMKIRILWQTLTTGTSGDGTAECYLPYGKYTIKETDCASRLQQWMTQKKNTFRV